MQDKINGLTGKQGVIIPATSQPSLMLNPEVVSAIEDGKFHIYSVHNIDEAMEILTGRPAGLYTQKRSADKNSINALIQKRLQKFYALANKSSALLHN